MRLSAIAILSVLCVTVFAFPQTPHTNPIPYFIDDGKVTPGAFDRLQVKELARWALEAWSRESANKLKFVEAGNKDAALIQLHWVSANEGLFGETERVLVHGQPRASCLRHAGNFATGRTAGDAPFTPTSADRAARSFYLTCVHELAHAHRDSITHAI